METHFDVIVVGSGFGGSVMAYRLAEAHRRVCLLERGKAYPPGSFARTPLEMRSNLWDPSQGLHGLFDIWSFDGMDVVTASGLGGGSLNYANVLIRKPEKWFVTDAPDGSYEKWPLSRKDLDPHYDAVERIIGVESYPLEHPPYSDTPKTNAFRQAAERLDLNWELPPLAVTFTEPGQDRPFPGRPFDLQGANLHRLPRETCRLCGECDVGCNYGSKNTLDYNYLSRAKAAGADLRTHCEVRSFRPRENSGFEVDYVYHDPEREGEAFDTSQLQVHTLTTDSLVLSAGTLGSTFLMLKSLPAFKGLKLPHLGRRFSGNGDLLNFAVQATQEVDGRTQPRILEPSLGTVITSTIHTGLDSENGHRCFLQDAGYPAFMSWLVEASDAGGALRRLAHFVAARLRGWLFSSSTTTIDYQLSRLLGGDRSASMLPILGMGMDVPEGTMTLSSKKGNGRLELKWPNRDSARFFGEVTDLARRVAGGMG